MLPVMSKIRRQYTVQVFSRLGKNGFNKPVEQFKNYLLALLGDKDYEKILEAIGKVDKKQTKAVLRSNSSFPYTPQFRPCPLLQQDASTDLSYQHSGPVFHAPQDPLPSCQECHSGAGSVPFVTSQITPGIIVDVACPLIQDSNQAKTINNNSCI